MTDDEFQGLYGAPPDGLSPAAPGAIQFSPLMPGAAALEAQAPNSLAGFVMLAPPGTIERRYAAALGLQALAAGAPFTILAPKDRGGSRLAAELEALGCIVQDQAKRHHRICTGVRPATLVGLDEALAEGGPRQVDGLWSQPGVFSWDRLDPGSALLAQHLPALAGRGADFGCGIGTLALAALASPKLTHLALLDIDRRAVEAAKRNVTDPRVTVRWADVRQPDATLTKLDFVVMNPPFHDGGAEDRSLGQTFIRRAAESLRTGGRLWLTANRHLPYEAVLKPLFKRITPVVEASGYKVYEAQK
ncbi:class I SAM-dependent methyltransferase [Beijerinckia sp. L45]|uniref:class I SAM-dependent methyltransferase n=1 Tax=Beijerinckia sp. L45 TaxID=1641855 RepID=UPI001FEE1503|nr:class I SAM-dependent methyltransferase [Beijerinckia sp. L45]